ncbi:haloacid dehalogenase-like hydrolase [Svornostia abyssi]|uniref:Haloacid dehalogenase-like hydrolase n=1 Tax=Svornostia abyssi TaxID=2898438 RepID=A0ABY5PM88_9ACTN|nr:haloacid dehalogenase-like hydrolase [Parviterribacteraceae bacterium J379]
MTVVLLWDIDGTLLSTARAGVFALEHAARVVTGAPVDLQAVPTAGMTDAQIAEQVLRNAGHTASEHEVQVFLDAYAAALPGVLGRRTGRVLPGVREVLDDLADDPGVLSLLLTGNIAAGAAAKLAHYRLDDVLADGAFCTGPGPRSAIAERAMQRAALRLGGAPDPARCFVLGDTPADVACATAVGVRTIAIASGSHTRADLLAAGAWHAVDQLPDPARFRALIGVPAAVA